MVRLPARLAQVPLAHKNARNRASPRRTSARNTTAGLPDCL